MCRLDAIQIAAAQNSNPRTQFDILFMQPDPCVDLVLIIFSQYVFINSLRSQHICTHCVCGLQLQLESIILSFYLLFMSASLSAVILCRNVTFHYSRSSAAYFGGMCSVSRGVGVNEVRFCCPTLSITLSTYHSMCVTAGE